LAKPLTDLFMEEIEEPALKNFFWAEDSLLGDFENLLTETEGASTDVWTDPKFNENDVFGGTIDEEVFLLGRIYLFYYSGAVLV